MVIKEDFQEILNLLQKQIALNHSEEKADLFIEFLRQKKELESMIDSFESFVLTHFKEELKMKMRNTAKIFQESFGKIRNKKEMKNNLFSQVPEETKQKISKLTDDWDKIETIVDEAYRLYMPQVRDEITNLCRFLISHFQYPPKNILEIGTKFGGTFYLWNKLWEESENRPNCISIDMDDSGIHGGISEEEMDKRDLWFAERFPNCHFIRGDSHENSTLAKLYSTLFPDLKESDGRIIVAPWEKERIDFLFIDGDHSYEGVKKDFEDYSLFVKKGGLIIFHDIVISERHHERNVYVGEFWNHLTGLRRVDVEEDICIYGGNEYQIFEFVEPGNDWAGFGALLKL